jgi:hypothetical protein
MSIAIPATSGVRNDEGVRRERFYRPELDCLGFVAFFAIFIFHTSGAATRPFCGARRPLQQVDCERGFGR